MSSNKIEKTGIVKEILGSARFKITLESDDSPESNILTGKDVICTICGKMRQKRIKIVKGDKVKVSLLVFSNNLEDLKGVITFRLDY